MLIRDQLTHPGRDHEMTNPTLSQPVVEGQHGRSREHPQARDGAECGSVRERRSARGEGHGRQLPGARPAQPDRGVTSFTPSVDPGARPS